MEYLSRKSEERVTKRRRIADQGEDVQLISPAAPEDIDKAVSYFKIHIVRLCLLIFLIMIPGKRVEIHYSKLSDEIQSDRVMECNVQDATSIPYRKPVHRVCGRFSGYNRLQWRIGKYSESFTIIY